MGVVTRKVAAAAVPPSVETTGQANLERAAVTVVVTIGATIPEMKHPAATEVSAGEDLPEWARRDSNARPLAPEASALSN